MKILRAKVPPYLTILPVFALAKFLSVNLSQCVASNSFDAPAQVQEQKVKLATCRKEHGTADMVELRRKIKWSVETNPI